MPRGLVAIASYFTCSNRRRTPYAENLAENGLSDMTVSAGFSGPTLLC
jgi:hypothetical protein